MDFPEPLSMENPVADYTVLTELMKLKMRISALLFFVCVCLSEKHSISLLPSESNLNATAELSCFKLYFYKL